jgi:3'(2'), 5'-bisphosphate nucleotidase
MNLNNLVKEVIEISKKAGIEIIKIYNTQNFEVQYKSDDSPLTLADQTSNNIIISELAKLSPKFPVISEESVNDAYPERKDYEYFWLVDPLDGTKEFVSRNGDFAVNIALVHRNSPILGVVYVPCTEGVFYAVKNEGAFSILNGVTKKLECNEFKTTDTNLRIPISRSYYSAATKKLIEENFKDPILIERGSALKFMNIAEGTAEIYPRIGTTMEWDTAAPQIIVEEAGGSILHLETRQPLVYNKEDLRNPDFVAMGKER